LKKRDPKLKYLGLMLLCFLSGGALFAAAPAQNAAASSFQGPDTGAMVNAANAVINGSGTIVVPDSLAATPITTTIVLGTNANLTFSGSGTFTGCNIIQAGTYSHIDLGAATLKLSGSNCTGISQTNTSTSQTGQFFSVQGGQIFCNGQVGATGIFVGNHATTRIRDTHIVGCSDPTSSSAAPTAGLVLYGTQFGSFDSLHLYGNYVGIKIYSISAGGGGNSNSFRDLNVVGYGAADSRSAVGVLQAVLGTFSQGANYFYNFVPLSNSVAGMAVFGANSSQSTVYVDGGSPEVNGGGATSVTIDGFTVKRASTYINFAFLFWHNVSIAEATVTPVIQGENYSQINLENPYGYGNASGQITACDATSATYLRGTVNTIQGASFCNLTSVN
jgi:hypothetical protein